MNELAGDGLPTSPIINKTKEGLAKGVSSDEINISIKEESKNLQFAKYLIEQSLLEGADIENKGKAIEILASSLPYNYQEDIITDIVKKGILNQKDIKEIAGTLDVVLPTQTTPALPSEEITTSEEPSSEEEITTSEEPSSEEETTTSEEPSSEEETTTPEESASEEGTTTPRESPSEEGATTTPTQIDGPGAP
ncbi:hypothetical protein ES708_27858 [subsurface metagenome]